MCVHVHVHVTECGCYIYIEYSTAECGHCKALIPVCEEVAITFRNEEQVS